MSYGLKELMADSIKIYCGMVIIYPREKIERSAYYKGIEECNECFSVNNDVIAYIFDNEMYVTPNTKRALEVLNSCHFLLKNFYVPFSNEDYPKKEKERWSELRKIQETLARADFVQECIRYCDSKGIKALDNEVLAKCFEIPECGFEYKDSHIEFLADKNFWFYPYLSETSSFDNAVKYLGKYCYRKDSVAFVYRDTRMFVAKGSRIVKILEANGYERTWLNIPLTSETTLLDQTLKKEWDSLEVF